MSKLKNIYLILHGETDWNRDKRFQGQTDVPLNATGKAQAAELVPMMAQLKVEAAFSSDLGRAYETAQIALSDVRLNIQKDPRLRETNIGEAEGLTYDEIVAKFTEESIIMRNSSVTLRKASSACLRSVISSPETNTPTISEDLFFSTALWKASMRSLPSFPKT